MKVPKGFFLNGWHIGIKNHGKDFGFIFSENICNASAIFTRNRFLGNPIIVGKDHIQDGKLQCIIVNSGNANVATGEKGLKLAYQSCQWTANTLQIDKKNVLPSSTGIIGKQLDSHKIYQACTTIPDYMDIHPNNFANAILTTDQYPKWDFFSTEEFTITGIAKGAGMIHPNMATMLAYIITDLEISSNDLQSLIDWIANKTFNRISVDSDTSTSDTLVIMANGQSKMKLSFPEHEIEKLNYLNLQQFQLLIEYGNRGSQELRLELQQELKKISNVSETAILFLLELYRICLQLSKKIVQDGEGATKIFRVNIFSASNQKVAEKIGRSIINSPLIKTAIFGGDPNWGRILMAIGKVFEANFNTDSIQIFCNQKELFPHPIDLEMVKKIMQSKEIYFDIYMNQGNFHDSFWGCDLTYDYVKLNSEYTT